jgi:hypothetical protein
LYEQGVPADLGDVVADMLIRAIDAPGYQLLERRQVKRVLEEQAFATSDLTQPGEAVRYGRLANTRFVIVGTVYRVDVPTCRKMRSMICALLISDTMLIARWHCGCSSGSTSHTLFTSSRHGEVVDRRSDPRERHADDGGAGVSSCAAVA